jgi:hypothetical protein
MEGELWIVDNDWWLGIVYLTWLMLFRFGIRDVSRVCVVNKEAIRSGNIIGNGRYAVKKGRKEGEPSQGKE